MGYSRGHQEGPAGVPAAGGACWDWEELEDGECRRMRQVEEQQQHHDQQQKERRIIHHAEKGLGMMLVG
jgi:hypothetical protein